MAAMKNIPFAEGTLPDLPANMPSVPPGYVLIFLSQCQSIAIQVVVFRNKMLTSALKSNMMHSSRILKWKGVLPTPFSTVLFYICIILLYQVTSISLDYISELDWSSSLA